MEWQPIETIPKDRWILAFDHDLGCQIVRWIEDDWYTTSAKHIYLLMNWMELPAPPKKMEK